MITGDLHQAIIAMGLGRYHHTDFEATFAPNAQAGFNILPPVSFYGHVIHSVSFGDVIPNAFRLTAIHYGYWQATKNVHPGIIAHGSNPWVWIEPQSPIYFVAENLLAVPAYLQMTIWEIYFPTKAHMDLAKLAVWESIAPKTYKLAVDKGIIPAILEQREL